MKSLLLEVFRVAQSISFWILALPVAAIFALFVMLWDKLSRLIPGESFPPAGASLTRASA